MVVAKADYHSSIFLLWTVAFCGGCTWLESLSSFVAILSLARSVIFSMHACAWRTETWSQSWRVWTLVIKPMAWVSCRVVSRFNARSVSVESKLSVNKLAGFSIVSYSQLVTSLKVLTFRPGLPWSFLKEDTKEFSKKWRNESKNKTKYQLEKKWFSWANFFARSDFFSQRAGVEDTRLENIFEVIFQESSEIWCLLKE